MKRDLDTIRSICGDEAADALLRVFPGVRVYVPKFLNGTTKADRVSPLMRIGASIARRLSAEFGGCTIYVPRNAHGAAQRRRAIASALAKGMGTQAAALHVGCCERTVQMAKKRSAAAFTRTHDIRSNSDGYSNADRRARSTPRLPP